MKYSISESYPYTFIDHFPLLFISFHTLECDPSGFSQMDKKNIVKIPESLGDLVKQNCSSLWNYIAAQTLMGERSVQATVL